MKNKKQNTNNPERICRTSDSECAWWVFTRAIIPISITTMVCTSLYHSYSNNKDTLSENSKIEQIIKETQIGTNCPSNTNNVAVYPYNSPKSFE
jgi:hypothetical protein